MISTHEATDQLVSTRKRSVKTLVSLENLSNLPTFICAGTQPNSNLSTSIRTDTLPNSNLPTSIRAVILPNSDLFDLYQRRTLFERVKTTKTTNEFEVQLLISLDYQCFLQFPLLFKRLQFRIKKAPFRNRRLPV